MILLGFIYIELILNFKRMEGEFSFDALDLPKLFVSLVDHQFTSTRSRHICHISSHKVLKLVCILIMNDIENDQMWLPFTKEKEKEQKKKISEKRKADDICPPFAKKNEKMKRSRCC